jgi:hypothetical protein
MDVIAQIVECPKCHRKIVVSNVLIGVSHTAAIHAICLDCIDQEKREEATRLYSKPNRVPQTG